MTLIPTDQIYYNTRTWWAKNFLESLPNDDLAWQVSYKSWLASQGAKLIEFQFRDGKRVVDSLGVAPGYDQFEFQRDEDAVIFVMKWR